MNILASSCSLSIMINKTQLHPPGHSQSSIEFWNSTVSFIFCCFGFYDKNNLIEQKQLMFLVIITYSSLLIYIIIIITIWIYNWFILLLSLK